MSVDKRCIKMHILHYFLCVASLAVLQIGALLLRYTNKREFLERYEL